MQNLRLNGLRHGFADVFIDLHSRRARAVMLMLAVALATGALVASLGISQVAARQVAADLAASTLNTVTVTPAQETSSSHAAGAMVFPGDAVQRAHGLGPVQYAGLLNDVSLSVNVPVTRPPHYPEAVQGATVAGLTAQYPAVLGSSVPEETAWLLDTNLPVVFVGEDLAETLGISQGNDWTGINLYIDRVPYSVVGLVSSSKGNFSSSALIPYQRGLELTGGDGNSHMKILTEPGAGNQVAQTIRMSLMPQSPEQLVVSQVQNFEGMRAGVSTQLDKLAAFIGGFLLLLTVLLIANAMTVSVMSRTGEIGVRRALGASQWSVASLFLIEGFIIGTCGGLAGSAIASTTIALISVASSWSIAYPLWFIFLGPTVGITAGLISSAYPAYRAGSIQPALAVRSD